MKIRARSEKLLDLHFNHSSPYMVEFFGYQLELLPNVFCPAYGEGSFLMGHYITHCLDIEESDVVLDMGTGSGALAILTANIAATVVASDISPFAVECANNNVLRLGLEQKITILNGDLFEKIKPKNQFSLIFFNTPFMKGKPKNWLEMALYDNEYSTLEKFIKNIKYFLRDSGRIYLAFSNCGDTDYLFDLIEDEKMNIKIVRHLSGEIEYYIYELTARK